MDIKDIPGKLGFGGSPPLMEINSGSLTTDIKKINTMKDCFNIVTIILLIGLLSSLLIPKPRKTSKISESGITTHI